MSLSSEIIKLFIAQGAGVIIAALLIWMIYKLAVRFGNPFIDAQREQARAMTEQATCLRGMKDTVSAFVMRDNSDHREILCDLQVVIKEVQQLSIAVKVQEETIARLGADPGPRAGHVARL